MKRLRVYLSSTFEDLKEHRAAVFAALERAGLEVARMEAYTASEERPLEHCLRDVAASDLYVGIFAWRYGYPPPIEHGNREGKSITELEFGQAVKSKLPKLLFLAHSDTRAAWPDALKDEATGDNERGAKISRLRSELGAERMASFFRTPDDLSTLVLAAILRGGFGGRPYHVPALVGALVPRPARSRILVDSLLRSAENPRVCTVIHGSGGVGKSTLALESCHSPEVINAFPDGVLWVTVGETPTVATLGELYALVTGRPPLVTGVQALGRALQAALGPRCLLVVDDVSRADDVGPFVQLERPLLITTRIRNLIEQAGDAAWIEMELDDMDDREAAALLGRGLPLDGQSQPMVNALAVRLGCWPLLLGLANKRLLEEHKSLDVVASLKSVTAIYSSRGVLGFDRRNATARNDAVAKSLADGLELAEREVSGIAAMAAELSIFPEDVPIPVRVLADLWGRAEIDVQEDVVRPLANFSILAWDRPRGLVSLHDMIRLALARWVADPSAVHRRLIEAWGEPSRLPHDYAWRWFGWHCMGAGQKDQLLRLVLDFDWLRAKLAAVGIDATLAELERVGDDRQARVLERSCRQAAHVLASDRLQIASQLLARLAETEESLRDDIAQKAARAGEPWLRPLTSSLTAEQSVRSLRPSGGLLSRVAMSSSGRWAVHEEGGRAQPGHILLWDLQEWRSRGAPFQTIERLTPFALALSDDAQWCLYADSIGGVHRLGGANQEPWYGQAHRDLTIATKLALSADGQRAVSACQHGRLVAWDISAGHHEIVWDESDNRIVALCLDGTGQSAVAARRDGSVNLLDLWPARPKKLFVLDGIPSALARSADKTLVTAATADGRIEVHSANEPASRPTTLVTEETPTVLALSTDGEHLAVGTEKGSVEVWSVSRGTRTARYRGAHTYEIEAISFSPDGANVTSADRLFIKQWKLEVTDGREVRSDSSRVLGEVKVTSNGRLALATLEDGRLGVWSLRTGALERTLPPPRGPSFASTDISMSRHLTVAATSARALAWNEDGMCVWDLDEGTAMGSMRGERIRDAAICPDGSGVVYADGHDIRLWRPCDDSMAVLGTYDGDPPSFVAISPDGTLVLSSGGDRAVYVWPLQTPADPEADTRPKRFGTDSRDKPAKVAFVGAREAVVTTGDGTLFALALHGAASGLMRLEGRHDAAVTRLCVIPERRRLLTSSYDRTVKLWDLETQQNVATLSTDGHIEQFSGSTQRLLLTTRTGAVKVVSLRDETPPVSFAGDKQLDSCAADANVEWIVARDQGGQLHFLHLEAIAEIAPTRRAR